MSQAFAARTYAELADVTADIPAGPIGLRPRTSTRSRAGKAAACCAFGIVLPALFAAVIVPGYANIAAAIATTTVIYLAFWLVGSFILIAKAEW